MGAARCMRFRHKSVGHLMSRLFATPVLSRSTVNLASDCSDRAGSTHASAATLLLSRVRDNESPQTMRKTYAWESSFQAEHR